MHHLDDIRRPSERTLARWQALSGLAFAAFLTLHLVDIMVSTFGPGNYDAFRDTARHFYQALPLEILLLSALIVHAVVGVWRWRRRGRPAGSARPPLILRVHRGSAVVLLLFVFGHAAATRLLGVVTGANVGAQAVSFALWWTPWFFYPYYAALALAGLVHGTLGVWLAARTLGVRVPRPGRRTALGLAVAASLLLLGIASFGGHLYPVPDPTDSDYARVYRDWFGVDLDR